MGDALNPTESEDIDRARLNWTTQVQERSLDRIHEWIRNVDTKASVILAMDTAMVAAIIALVPLGSAWGIDEVVWIALGIGLLLLSVGLVTLAIHPQVTNPVRSLLFFGDIAQDDVAHYCSSIYERTPKSYLDDLNLQCHVNSKIASAKFKWVGLATTCLLIGILPWLISIYLLIRG